MGDFTGGYTGAVDTASGVQERQAREALLRQQAIAALAQNAQQQRMMQARQQAGQLLYNQFPAGAGGGLPPPPPQAQPAPPPGSLSPGGGNPQASPPAPQQPGMVPPPPTMQAAPQRVAMPPQQIPPFKAMPSAPPATAPGQVPPPPQEASATAATDSPQPHPLDLKSIIGGLRKSGVTGDQVMDMLDTLAPTMNAQNKMELDFFKANNAALKAANDAYAKTLTAMASDRRASTGEKAEDRRQVQGDRNLDIKEAKEKRLRQAAASGAGGAGNLKTTELVYPKGEDGRPDETKPPIGVRGITKTGKIITLDAEGKPTTSLSGGTSKEAKDTKGSAQATVRANLVKSGVNNSLARLSEIDKLGDVSTSSFFGQHGDNPLTRGAYGAAKGLQGKGQQDTDAKWASMIDEAIPVFTGGLRGSDAFRRFLIEQAPGPGDKPETIREKKRLFRENIQGTSKAFFGKFQSDPAMWAPGTTKEDVQGSSGGATQQGEWKVEKVP